MSKQTSKEYFALPAIWTIGSLAIVPLLHKSLHIPIAGKFRFVDRKDPAAEEWRRVLENKWLHNRAGYYEQVRALWRWAQTEGHITREAIIQSIGEAKTR